MGFRYGLLTGLISILVSFGLYATSMDQSPLRFVGSLVLVGGIVLAMRYFKESNQGFMSFGEGVGIGAIISAVVGALSAIFSYVYMNFIDPDVVVRLMDKARADMEAKGGLSDEQIDQSMAMAGKFIDGPFMMVIVVLLTLFMGVVLALVASAFLKHSKPEFE
ncbi:DUF4199 domain-containing protein [Hymenobacter terrenus]|uniref:DUF4199 domain-containing protein n=1 Tax=Hymenobacter terrenus TaxID=1629124 RepID=UPI0018CC7F97|nr:DUF4199 domain-containing protein [Hymenobacter terrenus]